MEHVLQHSAPLVHHEWQGSVPSKWMDRGSGLPSGGAFVPGGRRVATNLREGYNGPCRLGLGGYFNDGGTKRIEELSQGKNRSCQPSLPPAHEREMQWRPSKRTCVQQCKSEPELLSGRPPFVQRKGCQILYHHAQPLPPTDHDLEVMEFKERAMRKAAEKKRRAFVTEDRKEKAMVSALEDWEQSHTGRGGRSRKSETAPAGFENSSNMRKSASTSAIPGTRFSGDVTFGDGRRQRSSADRGSVQAW